MDIINVNLYNNKLYISVHGNDDKVVFNSFLYMAGQAKVIKVISRGKVWFKLFTATHCEFLEYWNTKKKCLEDLTTFFLSTWWGNSKNVEEIELSRWLFEGRLRQGKNVLQDGLNSLCYFAGSPKSQRENSISSIFLESPHQVGMKNVVKSYKHFLWYFNTLKTHSVLLRSFDGSFWQNPSFANSTQITIQQHVFRVTKRIISSVW